MKYKLNEGIYKSKLKLLRTRDKILFHKYLVDLLDIRGGDKVLDLGCGYGNTLLYIAEKLKGKGRVIGVDIDKSSLAVAERILHAKINDGIVELIEGDLSKPLPFESDSFDRIVCHNILECITNKTAFINRGYRLLKKGGIMIVSHNDWDSQIYNSSHLELSRKLLHNYSDTTQEWMESSDGTIGRKLGGILKKTKFAHFSEKTYTVVNNRFKQQYYGYRIAQDIIKVAKKSGKFTGKELKVWLADLKEKEKNSDYYYSGNINLIIATK